MEGTGVPIRLDIWEFLRAKHIKYSSKDAFQEKNLTFDSLQRFLRGNYSHKEMVLELTNRKLRVRSDSISSL